MHARPRWPGSWVSTDLCTPLTRALATWMGISAAPNLQLFSKLVFTRLSFALTSRSNLALCWSVKAINYAEKKKNMAVGLPQDHRVELHHRVS